MSTLYQDLPFTSFPDSVQNFVTMLNMTVQDGVAVRGYQNAMQNGDYALAQTYYQQITNANQKFVDAEKMNTLMQTCIALQRFYVNDIEPYINTKQEAWLGRIEQFNYKGNFSSATQYEVSNFVTYTVSGVNRVYICILRPAIGVVPTNTTYWRELSIRGMQGVSGDGMSFRYSWDSSQTYYVNDIVVYNNAVWGCTAQNSNQAPASGSSYWNLIYSPQQVLYPFQSTTPQGLSTGYLWFEIKG